MLVRESTRRLRAAARRGMTVVESVLVMSVFLMLLFGIFEYCRFLLVLHVTNNAVRDGARYAAVRVNCDASQIPIVRQEILDYTSLRMGNVEKNIQGYQVAVYAVDQAGLDLNPAIIRPKSTSTTAWPDPFVTGHALEVPWSNVSFTERVAVTIKGTYKPLLPTFLLMPKTIPINITAMMAGES